MSKGENLKIVEGEGGYIYLCTECDKEFKSYSAFSMHKPCGTNYKKMQGKKKGKVDGKLLCPVCSGSMRLLGNGDLEKRAISAGYTVICKADCKEVL